MEILLLLYFVCYYILCVTILIFVMYIEILFMTINVTDLIIFSVGKEHGIKIISVVMIIKFISHHVVLVLAKLSV